MSSHPRHQTKQFSINTVTWTDIVAPIDCNYFWMLNSDGTAFKKRTDKADGLTECTVPANYSDNLSATQAGSHPFDSGTFRFRAGDVICSVLAVSGVGPIAATFTA